MTLRTVIILAFLLGSVGCDDDSPAGSEYNGTYELISHQESATCETPEWTDVEITDPYFRLHAESFFGTPIIAWNECTGNTDDTCDDSIDLMSTFTRIDGQWVQYMATSSFNGESICLVTLRRGILEETDTGVIWNVTTKTGTLTVETEEECDPDLAQSREDELECSDLERYEASLQQPQIEPLQ
ncbi:hypothetical protein KKF84_05880 [Myxococcota bacterium]|nr:hypothetical protein [Myxococcota bacterium]